MGKRYFTALLVLLLACDDGDLQIDTIDFDDIAIQDCGDVDADQPNVLFKINDAQALILELPSGTLKNEVTTTAITSSVPGASKVTYRLFSTTVATSYFCNDIPVAEPVVTEEIPAESGTVIITTTTQDSITFTHTIQLDNISFVTSDDERITDLRINDFGTVSTKLP